MNCGEAMRHEPTGGRGFGVGRDSMAAPRLLATLLVGASVPEVTGDSARIVAIVPVTFLDVYCSWLDDRAAVPSSTPARAHASGSWSGALLPVQREAGRLLVDLLPGFETVTPLPGGGLRVALACDLETHDRLTLWAAAGLDLVADLLEEPTAQPSGLNPVAALEPGIPQEMASFVLGLYGTASRPAPEAPDQASAA